MERHTGSKAAMCSSSKYRSTSVRKAVCSGGSIPVGMATCDETAFENVSCHGMIMPHGSIRSMSIVVHGHEEE